MSNNVADFSHLLGSAEMAISMKNPQTGFTYSIHSPLKGYQILRIIWYIRFWFAALIATKAQRTFGFIGLALVAATIGTVIVADDKSLAAIPALAYVALGIYFAPQIPRLYAQHYLAKGWVFADPEAAETIAARKQWQL